MSNSGQSFSHLFPSHVASFIFTTFLVCGKHIISKHKNGIEGNCASSNVANEMQQGWGNWSCLPREVSIGLSRDGHSGLWFAAWAAGRTNLAFSVPRPSVLRVFALALSLLLPSISKFAQQWLSGGWRGDTQDTTNVLG